MPVKGNPTSGVSSSGYDSEHAGTGSSIQLRFAQGRHSDIQGVVYTSDAQQSVKITTLYDIGGNMVDDEFRNFGDSILQGVVYSKVGSEIRVTLTFDRTATASLTVRRR